MIVIDASALLEVLLGTPTGLHVESRLFRPRETLHAPHLIDLEVAQVLRRYYTSAQLSEVRAREALEDLASFPLARYAHDFLLPRIWELRGAVTAYDAAYLARAEAVRAPLVTREAKLATAPGHTAIVEVF